MQILQWYGEILQIPHSRRSRLCFEVIIGLDEFRLNVENLNWITQPQTIYYAIAKFVIWFRNLTYYQLTKRKNLLKKVINHGLRIDIQLAVATDYCALYSQVFWVKYDLQT